MSDNSAYAQLERAHDRVIAELAEARSALFETIELHGKAGEARAFLEDALIAERAAHEQTKKTLAAVRSIIAKYESPHNELLGSLYTVQLISEALIACGHNALDHRSGKCSVCP